MTQRAAADELLDRGRTTRLAPAWPGRHEGASGPVEREAAGGDERPPQSEGRSAGDPECRDRLEGEEADAEPGAVPGAPERQRELVLPPLRHLPAGLWYRQAQDPCLTKEREERERGRADQSGPRPDEASDEPENRPERCGREDRREGKEGNCEALTGRLPHTAGVKVSTMERPQGDQAPETPARSAVAASAAATASTSAPSRST